MKRLSTTQLALRAKKTLRPGEAFAIRLHDARTAKRWSQQQLADRLAELGCPIHRVTLAKYEQGLQLSQNVSLEHVLAIAVALGVAPIHLFVPFTDASQKLRVTP